MLPRRASGCPVQTLAPLTRGVDWRPTSMMTVEITKERKAAEKALLDLQRKLAEAPEDDWRSSLAWEEVQKTLDELANGLWYCSIYLDRHKPEDFRHWREKYGNQDVFLKF
jgi:hypothetical protein